ncbi:MAG: hypothetical protein HFF04_08680 [Oscillospiraceae bacterium]|nr:hypothetical protein [Oscillospiraceae bacterium]
MAAVVAQFFQIIGVDSTPPTNMAELIPYLLTVAVGMFLVSVVFRLIAAIVRALLSVRRF